jgi:hypothetical protein
LKKERETNIFKQYEQKRAEAQNEKIVAITGGKYEEDPIPTPKDSKADPFDYQMKDFPGARGWQERQDAKKKGSR